MWEELGVCREEKGPRDLREGAREELSQRPQGERVSIEEGGHLREVREAEAQEKTPHLYKCNGAGAGDK